MRVLLTGATGMVGSGVLLECLESPLVGEVVSISRRPCGRTHPKLREIIHNDFLDYSSIFDRLSGFDACFFCLGVSSMGTNEADYTRITVDYPIRLADALLSAANDLVFILLTGSGTDQTMQSKTMWARVKGRAEAEIAARPFRDSYSFRPAYIEPMKGIKPSWWIYKVTKYIYPLLKVIFPGYVTSTDTVGQAMIAAAQNGYSKKIIECRDINALALTLSSNISNQ